MVSAYVLVNIPPPEDVKDIVKQILEIKGVIKANALAGPYDAIVEIESINFNKIVNTVMSSLRKIKGIKNTITLYVAS